jgi:hypothetical protein
MPPDVLGSSFDARIFALISLKQRRGSGSPSGPTQNISMRAPSERLRSETDSDTAEYFLIRHEKARWASGTQLA